MINIRKLALASSCTLVIWAVPIVPASAQTTLAAAPGTAAESAKVELQEIVVTARRREERLQDVPISIQALQGPTLQKLNITKTTDLNAMAAGLSVNVGGQSQDINFAMRGQTHITGGFEPGVQVYLDQLPVLYGMVDFYDIAQVEVLHGPQGTLFGRNTTGGAVVIRPQAPSSQFGGYVEATAGNLNAHNFEGAVNIPIVADKLAVRLSGLRTRRDGYVQDVITGEKFDDEHTDALRGQVLFTPIESFENKTLLNYRHQATNGHGWVFNRLNTLDTMFGPGTTMFVGGPGGPFATANAELAESFALNTGSDYRKVRFGVTDSRTTVEDFLLENVATLKLNEDVSIRDIFGYGQNRYVDNAEIDGTSLPLLGNDQSSKFKMYTDELQVFGKALDNKLDWIVGGYYQDNKTTGPIVNEFTALGGTFITASTTKSLSKALYAQESYQFTPKLSFTSGLRWTWDSRSGLQGNGVPGVPFPLTNPTNVEDSAPNWTVSFNYKLQPDTLLYVATRRGYKAGGVNFQAHPPTPTSFREEDLTDVEAGLKTQFETGDVRQRLNLAYYHSWYDGVQSQTSVAEASGQIVTVLFNAGKARIDGIETEYNARFGSAAALTVNYAYTDFEFTHFFNPFTPGGGANTLGLAQADVAKHKLAVIGDLYAPIDQAMGSVYLSAKYYYQSTVQFYTPPFAGAVQGGYGTVDLSLNWDGIMRSRIDLSFFVKNLTDKTFLAGSLGGATTDYSVELRGEPRTFGAKVRYSF